MDEAIREALCLITYKPTVKDKQGNASLMYLQAHREVNWEYEQN